MGRRSRLDKRTGKTYGKYRISVFDPSRKTGYTREGERALLQRLAARRIFTRRVALDQDRWYSYDQWD